MDYFSIHFINKKQYKSLKVIDDQLCVELKFCNYNLVHILILPILFSSISFISNLPGEVDNNSNNGYNLFSLNFLQNSYAIETDEI